jgi:hypothetical protein
LLVSPQGILNSRSRSDEALTSTRLIAFSMTSQSGKWRGLPNWSAYFSRPKSKDYPIRNIISHEEPEYNFIQRIFHTRPRRRIWGKITRAGYFVGSCMLVPACWNRRPNPANDMFYRVGAPTLVGHNGI